MDIKEKLHLIKKFGGCFYRPVVDRVRSGHVRKLSKYARYYKHLRIDNNTILYEAFFGRGMLCNPYALFLQLIEDPKYMKYKHVWVLDNVKNHTYLVNAYSNRKNVIFINYESRSYLKYLCKAKYLINNVTFPSYFTKKEGQVYINTWHGIPLKSLGFDMPDGKIAISNSLRNFIQADYLISANKFLTHIYNTAFKMENIYNGKIIEEGYPRLDLLKKISEEDIYNKLRSFGVNIERDKKIILYAPTWRGKTYANVDTNVDCYFEFKAGLEKLIDISEYQILIKVHQRVYQLAKDNLTEAFFIPATIDANEILSITDILISDFSSIYFDFLSTRKPILFFIPDAQDYKKDRGFYSDLGDLPGPHTDAISELADWINSIDNVCKTYKDKYDKTHSWSTVSEAGTISQKIIDIVFNGNESTYKVIKNESQKIKLLISRGDMRVNGISTSLINLLENIDYNRFDVSVMVSASIKHGNIDLVHKINRNARVFFRNSTFNLTTLESIYYTYLIRFGTSNCRKIKQALFEREIKRCYGEAEFDYVIDFEGMGLFFTILSSCFKNAKKAIWLHSDMQSEMEMRLPGLVNIFNLYKNFDYLISCSYEIMLVNKHKLSAYADEEKFKYAKNAINIADIKKKLSFNEIRHYNEEDFIAVNESDFNGIVQNKFVRLYPSKLESGQLRNVTRFVTVGRLSPEKNHIRLINGFYKLYQETSNIMLYILGDGPNRKALLTLIQQLGLEKNIFLVGNVKNPFSIMKNCQCFVLPSFHEGQPMVIHEARALNMPIIVSNFESVAGVCVENGQLIVGTSEIEIYQGLKEFIHGGVPSDYVFDINKYNNEASDEFLKALEIKL